MSDNQPAAIVKDLFKSFRLPHEQHSGIKQLLINFAKHKKGYEIQHVLDNVSFEIQKGEFFGIVGRNGSGKSTLLKLLAGIYAPDQGLIQVNGTLTPFIELGVGFNPELTGRDNVFLNGALLGFSRSEMENMYDEIISFAELERFMDQKLKNYSSGMQVRLAFSIAIRARTPILLIDEVLAVGDSEFQSKCYVEFRKLKEAGKTIVFVTHDMSAVERFCDRVLVLNSGKVEGLYTPRDAAIIYEKMNTTKAEKVSLDDAKRWGTGEVSVKSVNLKDKQSEIKQGDEVHLEIEINDKGNAKDITVGLAFYDIYGVNIAGPNSYRYKFSTTKKKITYSIPKVSLVPGEYSVTVAIFDKNIEREYDHITEALKLRVVSDQNPQYGKVNLFGKWS